MGNDLINENEFKDKEPENYEDEYIRYGVISKKCGEKSYDDSYITQPNLSFSDNSKNIDFSLFGVFDGHNSDYISKYLSNNINEFYKKEIGNMNKDNYKEKKEEIFKNIDKEIREQKKGTKKGEEKEEDKNENKINENNTTENKNNENNEDINYIELGIDEKEINLIKDSIKNSKDIPEELKEIDDSELKNLILFKNLFKYNNVYLYNNNDTNYIGSSASVVLINNDKVITADLGLTKCIVFNKDGIMLNSKISKNFDDHTFNCKEEKKRIKKFNKSIDYQSLKRNFYVPASRCFGFYKYKDDDILKEENQIISCVPDVNIYDRKNVDFILLITRGAIPLGDSLKNLLEKIKNICINTYENSKNFKLTELIDEYIKYKDEEKRKINYTKNCNTPSGITNKPNSKSSNSIYIGKEDFGEENVIINELNSTYYKDIMGMNKNFDCNGDYNMTCILIQLLGNKKPDITPNNDDKSNNKDNKNREENKKVNEETTKDDNNKKEEVKNEIKEDKVEKKDKDDENKEGVKNEIKEEEKNKNETNEDNVEKKDKDNENKEEVKNEIKEEKKEKENEEKNKDSNLDITEK